MGVFNIYLNTLFMFKNIILENPYLGGVSYEKIYQDWNDMEEKIWRKRVYLKDFYILRK